MGIENYVSLPQVNNENINKRPVLPPITGKPQTSTLRSPKETGRLLLQEPVPQQMQQNLQRQVVSPRENIAVEKMEKKPDLNHHNELLELNERVLQRDEVIFQRDNQIGLYKNEIESLKDECGKLKSKLHAVELYASELQRKNDLLSHEISERNGIIQEIQSVDMGMKAQYNMVFYV